MMKETNSIAVRDEQKKTSSMQSTFLVNGKEIRNPLLAKVLGVIATVVILGAILFIFVPVFLAAVAVLILGLVGFYIYARFKLKSFRKSNSNHSTGDQDMTDYEVINSRVPGQNRDADDQRTIDHADKNQTR